MGIPHRKLLWRRGRTVGMLQGTGPARRPAAPTVTAVTPPVGPRAGIHQQTGTLTAVTTPGGADCITPQGENLVLSHACQAFKQAFLWRSCDQRRIRGVAGANQAGLTGRGLTRPGSNHGRSLTTAGEQQAGETRGSTQAELDQAAANQAGVTRPG
ncbi:unnamed protein product [Boreogadus saida]